MAPTAPDGGGQSDGLGAATEPSPFAAPGLRPQVCLCRLRRAILCDQPVEAEQGPRRTWLRGRVDRVHSLYVDGRGPGVRPQLLLPSFQRPDRASRATLSSNGRGLETPSCRQDHARPAAVSWSPCLSGVSKCCSVGWHLVGPFRYEHSRASPGGATWLASAPAQPTNQMRCPVSGPMEPQQRTTSAGGWCSRSLQGSHPIIEARASCSDWRGRPCDYGLEACG